MPVIGGKVRYRTPSGKTAYRAAPGKGKPEAKAAPRVKGRGGGLLKKAAFGAAVLGGAGVVLNNELNKRKRAATSAAAERAAAERAAAERAAAERAAAEQQSARNRRNRNLGIAAGIGTVLTGAGVAAGVNHMRNRNRLGDEVYGPVLPGPNAGVRQPGEVYGPVLPGPNAGVRQPDEVYGPVLPGPNRQPGEVYGPVLPGPNRQPGEVYGPALPGPGPRQQTQANDAGRRTRQRTEQSKNKPDYQWNPDKQTMPPTREARVAGQYAAAKGRTKTRSSAANK